MFLIIEILYFPKSTFNINWIYWIKSVFDKDRIGFITYNNLKNVNKSIGLNYTDNWIMKMIKECDLDKDMND